MIQKGNSKLGKSVWTWSIPAGTTCPGASEACLSVCYAMRGFMVMPSVAKSHRENREASASAGFVNEMTAEIGKKKAKLFRIHVAGDFYSAGYVRKWTEIARRCPDTLFYAYTRSWTRSEIAPAIREFSEGTNIRLWLSFDRSMPLPPIWPGTHRCYMAMDDEDLPPPEADLVFRNKHETIMKSMNGVITCPPENGVTETTCEQCRLCFREKEVPIPKLYQLAGVAAA